MKRPAFQFYPADWRKDVALQSCSMAAQGLWVNILCLAHECEPYGHLMVNGNPMTYAQIGRQVGLSAKEADTLIKELESSGVVKRADDGSLFSKRMVDDERVRNARAAGGIAGAEHGVKGAKDGLKGGRPKLDKGGLETPLTTDQKPPPSSSSSSSASTYSVPKGTGGKPPMEPAEIIFGYGVPLLIAAGSSDKDARSFLGGLRKAHDDTRIVDALRDCLREKPLQPLQWLAAALPPGGVKSKLNAQEALEASNRAVADRFLAKDGANV